jgi:hypothetical protein
MLNPREKEKAMRSFTALAFSVGLAMATASNAQAPAGTTGVCKDGTYTSAATKRGACAGHGGVKEWSAEKAETAPATTTAPPSQPAAKAETTQPSPNAAEKSPATTKSANAMPAAGGAPGQVWVNTRSKVYHCSGTKWCGKTKQGEYMTEAAAKAAGNHPNHGKVCS